MAYADFSLSGAIKGFDLSREEGTDLVSEAATLAPSDWLRATLERTVPLALAVHGVVTTGSIWKFLRLEGSRVWINAQEYYLERVDKVLGILDSVLR